MNSAATDKKQALLRALYAHCAEHGMGKLSSVSEIARTLDIKRQLFYFYFESLDACIQELVAQHKQLIDIAFEEVQKRELTFLGYVHYMVENKDIYFFSMQCVRYQSQHVGFTECLEYSLMTMDRYNNDQFILHYELSAYPKEAMDFMYASFREYWWTHSGSYQLWDHAKVEELTAHVDTLINTLRSDHAR